MNAELARPTRTQGQGGELARLPLLDGVHVLVVDDDEDAREAVAAGVQSCGAEGVAPAGAAGGPGAPPRARPHALASGIPIPALGRAPLDPLLPALASQRGGE